MPLAVSERGTNVATGEVLDVGLFYNGKLELPPKERVIAFAVTTINVGSPGNSSDFLYSLDQGTNWFASDVNTLAVTESAKEVAIVGDYVVVVGGTATSYGMHFTKWSSLNTVTAPTWTRVTTGFIAANTPNSIVSIGSVGFIAAQTGTVYKVTDAPSGVEVMTSTGGHLNAIDAYDENTIVAVGASNLVKVCIDGENFSTITGPAVGVSLSAVAVLSPTVFLIGTAAGRLYYTTNGGTSWVEKSFSGAGAAGGNVLGLSFATTMVGFMSFKATGIASVLMTTDGGFSWDIVPSGGVLSLSVGYNRVGTLDGEPNLVILGGPNENSTTGSILIGEAID